MKAIDQTHLVKQYPGKWVVLDRTYREVLASDADLKKAIAVFRKKYGSKNIPRVFKVPTEIVPYIGGNRK